MYNDCMKRKYLKSLFNKFFKIFNYKVLNMFEEDNKSIIIAGPHTSIFDKFWLSLFVIVTDLDKVRFLYAEGHILSSLFKKVGGIKVSTDPRNAQRNFRRVTYLLNNSKRIHIIIFPDDTIKKAKYWKSGFYPIAVNSKIPVYLYFNNYKDKVVGIGPKLEFTGRPSLDMSFIRMFYKKEWAKNPQMATDIKLKIES